MLAAPTEQASPAEQPGKKLRGADSAGSLVPGAELVEWAVSEAERPGERVQKESVVSAAERLEGPQAEAEEPEQLPAQAWVLKNLLRECR